MDNQIFQIKKTAALNKLKNDHVSVEQALDEIIVICYHLAKRGVNVKGLQNSVSNIRQQLFDRDNKLREWITEHENFLTLKAKHAELANVTLDAFLRSPFDLIFTIFARETPVPITITRETHGMPPTVFPSICKHCRLRDLLRNKLMLCSLPTYKTTESCGHALDYCNIAELLQIAHNMHSETLQSIGITLEAHMTCVAKDMAQSLVSKSYYF